MEVLRPLDPGFQRAPLLPLIERRRQLVLHARFLRQAEQGLLVITGRARAYRILDSELPARVLRVRVDVVLDRGRRAHREPRILERG